MGVLLSVRSSVRWMLRSSCVLKMCPEARGVNGRIAKRFGGWGHAELQLARRIQSRRAGSMKPRAKRGGRLEHQLQAELDLPGGGDGRGDPSPGRSHDRSAIR